LVFSIHQVMPDRRILSGARSTRETLI
jgi:hypothetical protein